ncbi:MAG: hypothetical protein KDJ31_03820 [Candidatus Competibacteraceae bacterium]|nr:hypothetical protein [Candidatus Competibacteraceae bacterium]MCB1820516.1 hypothetical protein [Candidatus Competibacteraceae bacterium]HRY14280.1 DUF6036 family nucleotidyltransferase [Candidatus Competibacteraceae bacterium]
MNIELQRLPRTAYLRAVFTLFERIGATLPPALSEPVRAILVGGAAVHIYTDERVSKDVEAIFSRRILLPQDLLIRYTDETGLPRHLVYDYNYFSDIVLMHPDYDQDAVALSQLPNVPLTLAVLSPLDLAVSKLARFQDQDRQDILALARRGLLESGALQRRAQEALDYYVGDMRWIQHHLADALMLIAQRNK